MDIKESDIVIMGVLLPVIMCCADGGLAQHGKQGEGKKSLLSGVPKSLPALLKAFRIGEKTSRVGFDWPGAEGILDKVDILIGDVKWMNIIGKWVLLAMLTYFVSIALYICTHHPVTQVEVHNLEEAMNAGEILHYENEKNIARNNAKLDFIVEYVQHEKEK